MVKRARPWPNGPDGPDDEVPWAEAARRVGLDRSSFGRLITRCGVPWREVGPRGARVVSWAAVRALFPPPGDVCVNELARRLGVGWATLVDRAARRGVDVRRFPFDSTRCYIREADVPILAAPAAPPPIPERKVCRDCGEDLPAGAFYRHGPGGRTLGSYCKRCHCARNDRNARRRATQGLRPEPADPQLAPLAHQGDERPCEG